MKPFFGPFCSAIKKLTKEQKEDYNKYLNQCYIQARKIESGEASSMDIILPQGVDNELSIDNILMISKKYEETKKTMKRAEGENYA